MQVNAVETGAKGGAKRHLLTAADPLSGSVSQVSSWFLAETVDTSADKAPAKCLVFRDMQPQGGGLPDTRGVSC